MDHPELVTLSEVADLLRIGERTAYDPARTQRIPAAKLGGQLRIRRPGLDAWIARGVEAASPPRREVP